MVAIGGFKRRHAIATIIGFVIGAGILGLPAKFGYCGAGFLPGLAMLVVAGFFQTLTAAYIAETVLRTRDSYELPGYAGRYLGRWALYVTYASVLIYLLGALTAYVTFGGTAVSRLSGGVVPFEAAALAYWILGLFIVWKGAEATGRSELVLVAAFFVLLAATVAVCLTSPYFDVRNLMWSDWSKVLDTFGVTLFAYAAHFVIPTVAKELRKDPRGIGISASLGIAIPGLAYAVWTAAFMGLVSRSEYEMFKEAGVSAPELVSELGKIPNMWVMGYIFGLFTTMTSFIAGLYSLTEVNGELCEKFGVKVPRHVRLVLMSALPPLVLALARLRGFVHWLDLAGNFGTAIYAGIIPAIMVMFARRYGDREPEFKVPGGDALAIVTAIFYSLGLSWYILHDILALI